MTVAIVAVACLLVGVAAGWVAGVRRMPTVLAGMTDRELAALASQVAKRRRPAPTAQPGGDGSP